MRRLLPLLAVLLSVLGAGCGDDQADVGGDPAQGETAAQTQARTAPATTPASGCEPVEAPRPKDVGKLRRPSFRVERGTTYTALLETSCGDLKIDLAASRAPRTVSSFIALARRDFFDGLAFHRIVPGFVVQGGDPAGTGEGGPGYDVVEAPPENLKYTRGVVAMAKTELDEPGTSGSQFFIVTADDAGLPPDYALLGRVAGGDDVLDRLANVPNDPADNRPTEPVVIEDVTIDEG